MTGDPAQPLPSPAAMRKRVTELARDQSRYRDELLSLQRQLESTRQYLAMAPKIEAALQALGQKLFDQLVGTLEEKLTIALQEVLQQPIKLRADPAPKRGAASVEFYIERNGQHEDILRGQGGSVANILSVGLRMLALTTLDPDEHRRFLVLDEQDCWLRPDLVPHLVRIIHDAGKALGFQVLLISHHDVASFERYTDRIYDFIPQADGSVKAELRGTGASPVDAPL